MHSAWIIAALGMLGTTISPYLIFWQASEEREEKKSVVQADEVDFDTIEGVVWSNLLAYAMIVTGAVLLYGTKNDIQKVNTFALALKPVAGKYVFALFLFGIVILGIMAFPVLAGSTASTVTYTWLAGGYGQRRKFTARRFENIFSLFAFLVTVALTGIMVWQWPT